MRPPIVVLGSVEWNFLWQGTQSISVAYADRGHQVIYVEPLPHRNIRLSDLRRVARRLSGRLGGVVGNPLPDNIAVVSPITFPETNGVFRLLNRRWLLPRLARRLAATAGSRPIVYCWFPLQGSLDLVDRLDPVLLIYSCSDAFEGHRDAPKTMLPAENRLIEAADCVFVTSEFLLEKLKPRRPDARLRVLGADTALFSRADNGVLEHVRRLGFFGGLSDRLDYKLLRGLAAAGYTIRLIGHVRDVDLTGFGDGLELMRPVPQAELPEQLRDVDCHVLPYLVTELGVGIRPAKLVECYATGKPVVATELPDLRGREPLVYTADGLEGFKALLTRLPELEADGSARRARQEEAIRKSIQAIFAEEYEFVMDRLRQARVPK